VAAKWLLPEKGSEEALDLMTGPEMLFAPAHIRIEVLGAITRAHREGRSTRSESLDRCAKWLQHLDNVIVSLVPEGAVIEDAVKLSLRIGHTLQDCLYLAAARQLGARLITADPTFFKRAKQHFSEMEMLAGCDASSSASSLAGQLKEDL
jgi:predicted nucleic acid-binding protein